MWLLFNFLVRVVGVCFAIVGVIFAIWGLSLVLDPKATIGVNGVPSSDPWLKGMILVVGLVVAMLGVLLVFARLYRPDLESSNEEEGGDT
jgi:hypothetical protein